MPQRNFLFVLVTLLGSIAFVFTALQPPPILKVKPVLTGTPSTAFPLEFPQPVKPLPDLKCWQVLPAPVGERGRKPLQVMRCVEVEPKK